MYERVGFQQKTWYRVSLYLTPNHSAKCAPPPKLINIKCTVSNYLAPNWRATDKIPSLLTVLAVSTAKLLLVIKLSFSMKSFKYTPLTFLSSYLQIWVP